MNRSVKGATLKPEVIEEIVERLRSFTVGSLTIHKKRDRVVKFDRHLPETVDERGRVVPG